VLSLRTWSFAVVVTILLSPALCQAEPKSVDEAWSHAQQVNTRVSYQEFLLAYEKSRYSEQAFLRALFFKSEEKRRFVREISVRTIAAPQNMWGGISLSESSTISLDCLLTQCDKLFSENAPIPVRPKDGNLFVQVEALIEVSGSLPRTFISHTIVALFDGAGTESMTHSWHEPVSDSSAVGWTTNMQNIRLPAGVPARLKWLFIVPSETVANLRVQLFDGEIEIQELPASYESNDLDWDFPIKESRLSATF